MAAAATGALGHHSRSLQLLLALTVQFCSCNTASFGTDAPAELCLLQVSATAHPGAEHQPILAAQDVHNTLGSAHKRKGHKSGLRNRQRHGSSHKTAVVGGPAPAPSASDSGAALATNSTGSNAALLTGASVGAVLATLTGSYIGGASSFGLRAGVGTSVAGAIIGGIVGWILSGGGSELIPGYEAHEMAEPYTEKLHELSLTLLAITSKLENSPDAYNETFKAEIHADLEVVSGVLQHIEAEIAQGIHATPEDFHTIEEILTHRKYATFLSAEAAAADEAVLTAHDAALIEAGDDLNKAVAGEDTGPDGSLDSYEGDMIPGDEDANGTELFRKITDRSILNTTRRAAGPLWTNGEIYYCYAPDVSASIQHIFDAAVKDVNYAVPCLNFVNVGHQSGNSYDAGKNQACKASPAIFVQSNPNEGCYSYVGMIKQWPSQKLQLQYPGCNVLGIAVHELQHALGIAHEQARPDRNSHVQINWANIQPGMEHNFEINNKAHVGLNYDFLSNMHYDAFAFAVNRKTPTILEMHNPEHTANEVGQRVGLAKSDIIQLEQTYSGVASASCYSNSMTGLGCIDKPDNNGNPYCTGISSCTSEAVGKCCACGGGVKVQCYENMECPKVDPLPAPASAECIVDKSKLFPAGTGCVFTNRCDFKVKWKCPGLSCTHTADPGGYWQTACGATPQTQICQGACDVWKA